MARKKKVEIVKELIDDFGYEEDELKELTYAKLNAILKEEVEDLEALESGELEVETKKEKEIPKKKAIDRDDLVSVMNNVSGQLYYQSKRTGQTWEFMDYGQTDEMPVSELINMRNAHTKMLSKPYLVILDNDVVDYLGLGKTYENLLMPEQLENLFDLSVKEVEQIISRIPHGMIQTVVGLARKKYEEGSLSDIHKIRLIEDQFNVEILDD